MTRAARAALATPARLLVPEGLVMAGLLALPTIPIVLAVLGPMAPRILAVVAVVGVAIGWRFARGRVVHGLFVLCAAAALPLLPATGPALTLAALLIPLNLALIGLLPDRGILTRGGLLRSAALLAQASLVVALAAALPQGPDVLRWVPVAGTDITLEAVAVVFAAAILTLGALVLVTRTAPARGALWATVGALVAQLGHPAGPAYVAAAAGVVLIVASLEDAYALAYRDALTGLPSRRALDELLDRTARRFTVAMVDVDHFKAFNDRHGHDVGDQVLRMVATKLKNAGGGARAFRYGGEEFTLVFRGRRLEDIRPHLDAVRESIKSAEFIVRSPNRPKKKPRRILPARGKLEKLTVTVSIGAAERTDRTSPAAQVVKAADEALYRAKDAGRNRVVA